MENIPTAQIDMQQSIIKSRELLSRMKKGEAVIEQAYRDRSMSIAFSGIKLYGEIAQELHRELENALFMHDYLTTGKTVVINRSGNAVNIAGQVDKPPVSVDLWTLQSFAALKNTFGEQLPDFVEIIETEDQPTQKG